jgi:hypothetical protein
MRNPTLPGIIILTLLILPIAPSSLSGLSATEPTATTSGPEPHIPPTSKTALPQAHPGFAEWRIDKPILTRFTVLRLKDRVQVPMEIRLATPQDIPSLDRHWGRLANFDWPRIIDPTVVKRRQKHLVESWYAAEDLRPGDYEHNQVWAGVIEDAGQKKIEGLISFQLDPVRGMSELKFGETRRQCGYQGVGSMGLAFAVQNALLQGYIPYTNAIIADLPDGRKSPRIFFQSHGFVATKEPVPYPGEEVMMRFPDKAAAIKFLEKLRQYTEK